jgi:hypothetical protein
MQFEPCLFKFLFLLSRILRVLRFLHTAERGCRRLGGLQPRPTPYARLEFCLPVVFCLRQRDLNLISFSIDFSQDDRG